MIAPMEQFFSDKRINPGAKRWAFYIIKPNFLVVYNALFIAGGASTVGGQKKDDHQSNFRGALRPDFTP